MTIVVHEVEIACRYNTRRERLINTTVGLKLVLIALLQLTVPPSILPGTEEAEKYRLIIMFWTPLAASIQNLGLRVS